MADNAPGSAPAPTEPSKPASTTDQIKDVANQAYEQAKKAAEYVDEEIQKKTGINVKETVESTAQKVQDTVEATTKTVQETVEEASKTVSNTVEVTSKTVQDTVDATKTKVAETVEATSKTVQDTVSTGATRVQDNTISLAKKGLHMAKNLDEKYAISSQVKSVDDTYQISTTTKRVTEQVAGGAAAIVEGVKARDPTGVTAVAEDYVNSAYNWVAGVASSVVSTLAEEKNEGEGLGGEVDPLKKAAPPSAAESVDVPSSKAPSGELVKS